MPLERKALVSFWTYSLFMDSLFSVAFAVSAFYYICLYFCMHSICEVLESLEFKRLFMLNVVSKRH